MESLVLETSQQKCQLCQSDAIRLIQQECIEQVIQICQNCKRQLQNFVKYISCQTYLYKKKVEVKIDLKKIFYKLQHKQCEICFELKICCKICSNEHYFCLRCSQQYISKKLSKIEIKCPYDQCQVILDHLIIYLLMNQHDLQDWTAIRYNLFCPSITCEKNIIKFSPYKDFETQIDQIDNNQSQCSICQTKICNYCWTQFKGKYSEHEKICASETQRDKLLKQYIIENRTIQCSKCLLFSQNSCTIDNLQIQQCCICETKICSFCKLTDLQLFSQKTPLKQSCYNCYKLYHRRRFLETCMFFIIIPFLPFLLVFALILQLFEIGSRLIQIMINQISGFHYPLKYYLQLIALPLIIVLKIIIIIFNKIASILPFIVDSTNNFLKEQEKFYDALV